MRIKLHKNLRLMLIIFSIVLFSAASIMLYRELKVPKFKEEKVVLYSYNQKPDIKYSVFLKPNILYDKNNLEEGQSYLTGFVDYIQTYFMYEFTGKADAEIIGDYAIVAAVEGYTIQEKKIKTIWRKEFILAPKTEFKTKDKGITIEKEISLKLEEYNNLIEQLKETAKINVPAKLTLFMNINVKASTASGEIVEKLKPQLVIPLGDSHFEITKGEMEEKPGVIEEIKKIQLPLNEKMINLYGAAIGLAMIILSCLIAFTSNAQVDPLVRKLNSIFKKHGNRLVALNAEVAATCEVSSEVKSMDDLVRIADELGKPILYQYREEPKDITRFCVYDNTCTYAYDIKDITAMEIQPKFSLKKIKEVEVKIDKTKEHAIMS